MIYIDAGDGWLFFNDKEREAMDQQLGSTPEGSDRVELPADRVVRAKMMAAACMSFDCIPMPTRLAKHFLLLLREVAEDERLIEDVVALITEFEQMRKDHNDAVVIAQMKRKSRWN
jgi:hypothetical protein